MLVRSPKLLLTCIAIGLFALVARAQSLESITRQAEELRKPIDHAMRTSTFENETLKSFEFQLPGGDVKRITVEQSEDKRSFTLVDQKRRIDVALEGDGRLSSVVLPNGKRVSFRWMMMPNGYWVVASMTVDGKELPRSASFEDCGNICRNAAFAAGLAIATCAANGPLSASCFGATAAAAYATYLCYECVYPNMNLAQRREILIERSDTPKINYVHNKDETTGLHPGVRADRCGRIYL